MKYIVYKTTNKINGKIYVGVHRTNPDIFDGYIGCGVNHKDKKKTRLKGFPAAVRKYGYENFVRETLFEYPDTEEGRLQAFAKEAEIVNTDFVKSPNTYNLVRGGEVNIADSLRKEIAQYTIDGKFIRTWDSIIEAEQMLQIPNISQNLIGKSKYSGNYQWKYYTGDDSDIAPVQKKEKTVYQFDLQGNLIKVWKSATEASKSFNEKQNSVRVAINNCCHGKVNQAYGYFWSFKSKFEFKTNSHYSAVAMYNDKGEFIKSFTTLKEAAQEVGLLTTSNIISCIKGKQKHCAGYRWRYFYGNTDNINPLKDKDIV